MNNFIIYFYNEDQFLLLYGWEDPLLPIPPTNLFWLSNIWDGAGHGLARV